MKREIKLIKNETGDTFKFDVSDERFEEILEQFKSITGNEDINAEVAIKVFADMDLTDNEYTLLIFNVGKQVGKMSFFD